MFKHKRLGIEYLIRCGTFAKCTPLKIGFKKRAKNTVTGRLWIKSCTPYWGISSTTFSACRRGAGLGCMKTVLFTYIVLGGGCFGMWSNHNYLFFPSLFRNYSFSSSHLESHDTANPIPCHMLPRQRFNVISTNVLIHLKDV